MTISFVTLCTKKSECFVILTFFVLIVFQTGITLWTSSSEIWTVEHHRTLPSCFSVKASGSDGVLPRLCSGVPAVCLLICYPFVVVISIVVVLLLCLIYVQVSQLCLLLLIFLIILHHFYCSPASAPLSVHHHHLLADPGTDLSYPNCSSTLVTAYYKIPSKHSHTKYTTWMTNFLSLPDCLVVFVEPDLEGLVRALRPASLHPYTLIISR